MKNLAYTITVGFAVLLHPTFYFSHVANHNGINDTTKVVKSKTI